MTTLTVGNGINSIEENVFKNCDALSSVYIKDLSAWCNINFKGVSSDYSDIPYSTPLHKGAKLYLNNNELTELVIPDDVKIIGGCAFYGCPSITSVTIGDGVTEIGWYAFRKCPSLTSATIGNNITVVERGAFADCTSLNKVSFGESVKKLRRLLLGMLPLRSAIVIIPLRQAFYTLNRDGLLYQLMNIVLSIMQ